MLNRKIHIVFVIHNAIPVPYFNWFAEFASKSEKYKFSFVFLNEDNTAVSNYMEKYGCDIYHIPFKNDNKKKYLLSAFVQLYKLFKKIKPDITHSHLFYDGTITNFAARLAGIKIRIHTKQSTGFNWYYAPKAVMLDWFINFNATHLIAVSGECKDFIIQKEKAEATKISLVNHGIDFIDNTLTNSEQLDFIKKKYNPSNKFLIVMVARYIDWKGYKYLIEAASNVLKSNNGIKFLGVGTGPLKEELQELINSKNIQDSFELTGYIDRTLIPALYQSSTIYIHSAMREPFGFVIAEAMANALPIVSTNTGAARDAITHLQNGYLVSYESSKELEDGINFILNLSNVDRINMGEKARASAHEKFSFEKMLQGYLKVYENEINKRKVK